MKINRLMYIFMFLTNTAVFIFTNTRAPLIVEIVLIILPIISYTVLRVTSAMAEIECIAEESTVTGRELHARINIKSALNICPGLISFRQSIYSVMFDEMKERKIENEPGRGNSSFNISFKSELCGRHKFKIDNVKFCDNLRLFWCSKKFSYEKNIMVSPAPITVKVIRRQTSAVEQDGMVYDKFRRGNDKSEIFDLRDYSVGDDIRSVHWKLSSKMNKIIVREFSRPNNFNTMLLCDLSLETNGVKTDYASISDNISITEAISLALAREGDDHSVCMLGENVSEVVDVSGVSDCIRAANNMLSSPLSKKEFNTALAFSHLKQKMKISKLIYISSNYDIENIKLAAGNTDVMVITVSGDNNTLIKKGRTEIISLNKGKLYSDIHSMEI